MANTGSFELSRTTHCEFDGIGCAGISFTQPFKMRALGDYDDPADYKLCYTDEYYVLVSSTKERTVLGGTKMKLQIKVHRHRREKAYETCVSLLADVDYLQVGCGSATVDVFTRKNKQIRHLIVFLPSTFCVLQIGIPSVCHCGLCSCGKSMSDYAYPMEAYNDTGVNPYDEPYACKEYYDYTEDTNSDDKGVPAGVPSHTRYLSVFRPL